MINIPTWLLIILSLLASVVVLFVIFLLVAFIINGMAGLFDAKDKEDAEKCPDFIDKDDERSKNG